MGKKVLVILGHPAETSLCGALAESYAAGARESGHAVELVKIRDLAFDPMLHEGYKVIQKLEPDLVTLQEKFRAADHIAFFYPTWWGMMPARLKGLFDRMFLPGFGYKYDPKTFQRKKLLTGKTGFIATTMNTPPWYYRLFYRDAGIVHLKRMVLEFCGIAPTRVRRLGVVKRTPPKGIERWIDEMRAEGRKLR